MKSVNKKVISLGVLATTALCSCSGGSLTPIYHLNSKGEVTHGADIRLYFPKDNGVPYISMEDGVALASEMRKSTFDSDEFKYTLEQNNEVATVTDEKGTKAVFDANKQTVTIDHFDSFVSGYLKDQLPLVPIDINKNHKSIKIVSEESSYTPGNAVTLKLSDYPSIQLEKGGNNHGLLLPIAAFNDIFFSGSAGFKGIAYNYNNIYIANGMTSLGQGTLTPVGKHFYDTSTKKQTVSKDLAQYFYDETMFSFDYFYGLKGVKNISSFKAFAKEKGLENDLLSGDVSKMEDAYATLVMKSLEDGHTAYITPSAFTDFDNFEVKDSSKSEKMIVKETENLAMNKVRKDLRLNKPFEIRGDTAFIFFDDFQDLIETKLYGNITEQDIADNNACLFAYAYKEIKKNPEVKKVVVDLVTNNGGDATGLVYCLGTLIGKHYIDTMNPLTGARTHSTFMTDINVDGIIDEKDIPLCNDYKIYILGSKFAFSCGNLFPVAAKYNNPNVTLLGDTTGGGTCIVGVNYTGFGSYMIKSTLMMLTKKVEAGYTHIEDGAKPDIPVGYDRMLDRNYLVGILAARG